jgi:hypothetical protein
MSNRLALAEGSDSIQRRAASTANAVQSGVNIVAIVGCLHEQLLALHRSGICGDDLINHPVALAFVSKLNSLCRMTFARELAALQAVDLIQLGQEVQFEVIPI